MKGSTHMAIGVAIGAAAAAHYPFTLQHAALYIAVSALSRSARSGRAQHAQFKDRAVFQVAAGDAVLVRPASDRHAYLALFRETSVCRGIFARGA